MSVRKRLLVVAPEGSSLRKAIGQLPRHCRPELVSDLEALTGLKQGELVLVDASLAAPGELAGCCRKTEVLVVGAEPDQLEDFAHLDFPVLPLFPGNQRALEQLLSLWCRLGESELQAELLEELPWFGVYVLDSQLRIVHLSSYITKLLGRELAELKGQPVLTIVEERFHSQVKDIGLRKLQWEEYPPYLLQLVRADGKPVRCEVLSRRIDIGGQPHLVGVIREVESEQRRETLLRTLFRLVNELLSQTDPQAVLQRVADAIVDVGGFQRVVISLYDLNWPDPLEAPVQEVVTSGLSEEEVKQLLGSGSLSPEQRRAFFSEEFSIGPDAFYVPYQKNPFQMDDTGLPGTTRLGHWHPLDLLFIPLRAGGRIIGHISLDDPVDPSAPTPAVLEPIAQLAQVAALAVEQAHTRQLRERHERYLKALQAMGAHLLQATSLEDVLKRAVDFMASEIGYLFVGAGKRDGKGAQWLSVRLPGGDALKPGLRPEDWPGWREALGKGEARLVQRFGWELKPAGPGEEFGIRSGVVAPVLLRGEPVAFLAVGEKNPYALTETDRKTISNVANWCSIALETLRMRDRLSGLYQISHHLSQASSREELLASTMAILRRSFTFDYCAFFRAADGALELEALDAGEEIQLYPEIKPGFKLPLDEGIVGEVARKKAPVLTGNVKSHPKYVPGSEEIQSELAVPVLAGEELLGVLNVESREPNAFGGEELAVLQAVAGQLSMALQNLAAREKLKEMAIRDPLTGLYNRRFLDEVINQEVAAAKRYKRPLAFLYLDVDGFRAVNNTHGHLVGDEVLKRVARYIQSNVRQADYVFRVGGDEFLILLPETDGEANQVRERLKQGIKEAFSDIGLPIGLSVGVSVWEPGQEFDLERLIAEADRRMYDDKRRNNH